MSEVTYSVPGMSCAHCKTAVSTEIGRVTGVRSVEVDLDTKRVVVHGEDLDDASLKAAIAEAGYEAT